jgi:hypothetical protein
MASKTDFTASEWQAIRNAPQLVALATAAAGNSGLFGSVSEGIATASSLAEGARSDNAILRAAFVKEEMVAAQDEIKGLLKGVTDRAQLNPTLQRAAMDATATALRALESKGGSDDAEALRSMLAGIGEKVANASKEGSFLGFGGERVSEGERQFLAQLGTAIGRHTG